VFNQLQILTLEGVLSYRDQHFWRHSGSLVCGSLHVQISAAASEQYTVSQVSNTVYTGV